MADQPNTRQLMPQTTEYTYEMSHKDTEFGQYMFEAMTNWTSFIDDNTPDDAKEENVKIAFKNKEHLLIQIVKQSVDYNIIKDVMAGKMPSIFRLTNVGPSDVRESTFKLAGDILDFEDPTSKFILLTINNREENMDVGYTPDITAKANDISYRIVSITKWTAKSFEADAITI